MKMQSQESVRERVHAQVNDNLTKREGEVKDIKDRLEKNEKIVKDMKAIFDLKQEVTVTDNARDLVERQERFERQARDFEAQNKGYLISEDDVQEMQRYVDTFKQLCLDKLQTILQKTLDEARSRPLRQTRSRQLFEQMCQEWSVASNFGGK